MHSYKRKTEVRQSHALEMKAKPHLIIARCLLPAQSAMHNTLFKCSPLFQLADLSLASIPSLDAVRDYTQVTLFLGKKQEKVK